MTEQSPNHEEWRRLYEAAIAVKALGPWMWMYEDDLFAVEDPETGELGFVSVMGAAGEHFAVAVYRGGAGLRGFMAMQDAGEAMNAELALSTPQIQASFENRDLLTAEDRAVIKSLGLKFRGRNAWPWFRSYRPGFYPWYLNGEEARTLACALEQLLIVAPRFRDDDTLFYSEADRGLLVRAASAAAGELVWTERYQREFSSDVTPAVSKIETALIERFKAAPKQQMTIELDVFMLPHPVRDGKDDRPKYIYQLLLVEAKTGYVLGFEMMQVETSLEEMWAGLPSLLVRQLVQLGLHPALLKARPGLVCDLIRPLAQELGVTLQRSTRLPMLDSARKSLVRYMG
ncbi:MAG: hypothetical protein R2844_22635 [Caldilineales bacterium]